MNNSIVIIVGFPFCKRDFDRFGVEFLRTNGVEVGILDITELLSSSLSYIPPDAFFTDGLVVLKEKKSFFEIVNQNRNSIFINTVSFYPNSAFLYKCLSKLKHCVLNNDAIPPTNVQAFPLLKKIKSAFNLKKLYKHFFPKIPLSFLGVKPAKYIILGGVNSENSVKRLIAPETVLIKTHCGDFEKSLYDNQETIIDRPYAVFVDSFLPYHPEFEFMGLKSPCHAETYFSGLESFFEKIKNAYGYEVIVAAHPRSDYSNKPFKYENVKVIHGKTDLLIKHCKLAIIQVSTAVNYAVIYNKPMVFVNQKDYRYDLKIDIDTLAKQFEMNVLDVDIPNEQLRKELVQVPNEIYKMFFQKYIKYPDSENKSMWEIFLNVVKNK